MSDQSIKSDKEFKKELKESILEERIPGTSCSIRINPDDLRYLDLFIQVVRSSSRYVRRKEDESSNFQPFYELTRDELEEITKSIYEHLGLADKHENLNGKQFLKLFLGSLEKSLFGTQLED